MGDARQITACRCCGSSGLIRVVDLGDQHLTGVFPRSISETLTRGPLRLVWCSDCHLLQLDHSFDAAEMYGDNYGYRSGLNAAMVDHLTNKCRALTRIAGLVAGDIVIDIGSNDGTLLRALRTPGLRKVGVDPTAEKFRHFYDPDVVLVPNFFSRDCIQAAIGHDCQASLITSIAMFYDLESPRAFIRDVRNCLKANGVWHFEQSYMPSMLRLTSYDTICHEHLEYYSFTVIAHMLEAEGMKVIDVWMNNVNGGSFAVTAAKRESHYQEATAVCGWLIQRESHLGLNMPTIYRELERRVWQHREELRGLVHALTRSGKRIIGCGASTKGNVILQLCGLGPQQLVAISDVNEDKWGRFTPGTGIPIVSENDARALNPDYMLVLPWHFKDGIVRREQEFLDRGGRLIFPLPEIEIVGY